MGPMMGGTAAIWPLLLLVAALVVVAVLLASRGWPGALPSGRQRTPEERVARLLEDGVPGRGKARLEPPAAGEQRRPRR